MWRVWVCDGVTAADRSSMALRRRARKMEHQRRAGQRKGAWPEESCKELRMRIREDNGTYI